MIVDGRPNPDTKEEILDALVNGAASSFGAELDADSAIVLKSFYEPVAEYLATQQQDIASVLDASQIDHASGDSLDLLAALIGVTRNQAEPATTDAQFSRDGPTPRNYSIPKGTEIQTDATDPLVYETTEPATLKLLDDFEDNDISEYGGDTGTFTTQSGTVYDGTYALEGGASKGRVLYNDNEVREGSVLHCRVYLNTNTVATSLFGAQDGDNHYGAVIDASNNELRVEATDGGTTSTVGSAKSVTVPTGEWLHLKIKWDYDYDYTLTLWDSTDTELATTTVSDSSQLYTDGNVGFKSDDTNAKKYWDNYALSTVSVPVEATTSGADTNVGAQTLIVLKDTPTGIQSVTNWLSADDGRDKESDSTFRARAKEELSDGMAATLPGLITALRKVDEVRNVTVIDNDTDSTDGDGRPPHSFEPIVDGPSSQSEEIAQAILDNKAVGDTSVGGYDGTSVSETLELVNGQNKTITFSSPTQVQIYVDVSLTKTDEYEGDDAVQDSIVEYIGGTVNSGNELQGELEAGDDVIYNQVSEAIMNVAGVYDYSNLDVGKSSNPSGTSNISISSNENATSDATDSSLSVTSSDV